MTSPTSKPPWRRLILNGIRLLGGQGALIGLGFVQTLVATRALGPERFGAWALIQSFSTLVGLFLSFRTAEAMTSFWVEASRDPGRHKSALVFSSALYAELVTKASALLVVLVITPYVMRVAGDYRELYWAIAATSVARFLSLVDPLWFSVQRHEGRITELAVQPVLVAGAQLLMVLALLWLGGAKVLTFAIALLAAQVLSAVSKIVALWRSVGPLLGPEGLIVAPRQTWRERSHIGGFWTMMSAGYLSSCLSSLVKEADGVLIGMLAGTREIGYYRLAKSLVGLLQTAAQTLSTLLFQQFAELHADKNPAALRRFVGRIAPPLALCAVLGGAILAIFIDPAVRLLFGARYLPVVLPFRILLAGVCISSALVWVSPLLTMLRRMREVLLLNLATFIIFAAALAGSIPLFGGWGPAIAVSAAWSFGHLLGLWQCWRVLRPQPVLEPTR